MKYLGGRTELTQSYIFGMFSMGNINPERRTVGSIIPTREIKIACCIVFATAEIRIPIESERKIYSMLSASSRIRLPFTGKPNTSRDSTSIVTTFTIDRKK